MNTLLENVASQLRARGAKLATAESCTGGLLAGALTDFSGASAFYNGGVISYATEAKIELLNVPAELISRFGLVSAECAQAMARGAAEKFHTAFALSTTGIAGPDGGTSETPVGTVFIGLHTPRETLAFHLRASGTTREEIRREAVEVALNFLLQQISKKD